LRPPAAIVAPAIGKTRSCRPAIVSFCRKEAQQSARTRAAHSPSGLSSEFHACGAAPRKVRKALARIGTKHLRYFMPMTGWLRSLSLNPRIGRTTAGVTPVCGRSRHVGLRRLQAQDCFCRQN
jgi:hypothetical protein